ncbi:M20/M25/M40 family metallo-hydrolase [Kitasatospora sp. NPDC052896]|uniref:M20/M25/M40 family metallo-hydrolase n=1 Tax=Kitasatospora sp. NPDC052896 TaxID=3364061 RepID=UPI0037CC254F
MLIPTGPTPTELIPTGPAPTEPAEAVLTPADHQLLLDLLRLPTAGPLESGDHSARLAEAQLRYADAAAELGFAVLRHGPPQRHWVEAPEVPLPVRTAAAADPEFLARQPSLLLRLGGPAPRERTVMFNVHLDTVAGVQPVGHHPGPDGGRFTGRGAVDAKGPAVALLAGLRAAQAERPGLAERIRVLVQAVAGEEGGALGTFGTRPLVAAGHYGRLNVFCEPTGNRALPRSTAAMTARIRVAGEDAVDDRPAAGHNATVLLGFLAQHLAAAVDPGAGQLCVAGLHTGRLHNRVYGRGELLLNLAYPDAATAERLATAVPTALADGLRAFAERFADVPLLARTAADAERITRLDWLKRGLPALTPDGSTGEWLARLLATAGVPAWPADQPAFTCDAIWLADRPGTATVVLGPGTLDGNHAHAEGEFVTAAELARFARTVADLLAAFDADP